MPSEKWVTYARIVATSSRALLVWIFWLWGLAGLVVLGAYFYSLPRPVGVGTSAYLTAMILYWMGGMILFGLAGAMLTTSFDFQRQEQSK
jgi:hypothetical protein